VINRSVKIVEPNRGHIVSSLRRSAEEAKRDEDRFLARAYEEAAYSLEEHSQLNGAEILLACNSLERECRLMSTVISEGNDPEDAIEYSKLIAIFMVAVGEMLEQITVPM